MRYCCCGCCDDRGDDYVDVGSGCGGVRGYGW